MKRMKKPLIQFLSGFLILLLFFAAIASGLKLGKDGTLLGDSVPGDSVSGDSVPGDSVPGDSIEIEGDAKVDGIKLSQEEIVF